MLKKLFKYDWKSVSLILFILHGGLLIYSLIGRIGTQTFMVNNTGRAAEIITFFYLFIYILGIFAVSLATFFYMAVRIQKSLFSDEGYLTHTLPVTPAKLLLSKTFVFWLWSAIDIICLIASLSILLLNGSVWSDLCDVFHYMWNVLVEGSGLDTLFSAVLFLLAAIAQYFGYYTSLLMFSLCLGGQFKNHKILGAILSYAGIATVVSLINVLIMFFIFPDNGIYSSTLVIMADTTAELNVNVVSIYAFVFYSILGIAGFMGSKYILEKKLNLE